MRVRPAATAIVAAMSCLARVSGACPCQGSSGAAAGVTTAVDRFGASVTETARIVEGAWQSNGAYAPLAAGSRQWALDIAAIAGYRPISRVELSVEAAVGHEAVTSPVESSEHTGFGDTTLRVRWESIDEPMPFEHVGPWPALTLVAGLRIPTAPSGRGATSSAFAGTTGSAGASSSSEGLGAFEPSLAAALVRSFGPKWQVSAYGEAAYRFSDTYLGIERHLAPRALGQLGARYAPTPYSGIGVMTDLGWEGDVTYPGEPYASAGTSQRLWTLGAYGYFRVEPTGLRWGALARYAPPIDGIGRNAVRSTNVAVSLGYAIP